MLLDEARGELVGKGKHNTENYFLAQGHCLGRSVYRCSMSVLTLPRLMLTTGGICYSDQSRGYLKIKYIQETRVRL